MLFCVLGCSAELPPASRRNSSNDPDAEKMQGNSIAQLSRIRCIRRGVLVETWRLPLPLPARDPDSNELSGFLH